MVTTTLVVWTKLVALLRRVWLGLIYSNEPWDDGVVDVKTPAVRKMIARARLDDRRERGAMVCWSYSRDRVVERRELKVESDELKAARIKKAHRDRTGMWLVASMLALLLVPVAAQADTIRVSEQGCVTDLGSDGVATFASGVHFRFNVFLENEAGCGATTDRAYTTEGVYKRESFADGSELVTVYDDLLRRACFGRAQIDAQEVFADGSLGAVFAIVYNKGDDWFRSCGDGGSGSGGGSSDAGGVPPVPGQNDVPITFTPFTPVNPDGPNPDLTPTPNVVTPTPIPEPSSAVLMLAGVAMLRAMKRMKGKP
jgi:hypothetical protein